MRCSTFNVLLALLDDIIVPAAGRMQRSRRGGPPLRLDPHTVDRSGLDGPRRVTDAYLLALAVVQDGRFVTFDRSLLRSAVHGATADHLVVL